MQGQDLLITHIDEYILYGYEAYNSNSVNSLKSYNLPFGIRIVEASGNDDLWNNYDEGSSIDPFYDGNNKKFNPNTDPQTYYNNYPCDNDSGYNRKCSTVSIKSIGGIGSPITFKYSYEN